MGPQYHNLTPISDESVMGDELNKITRDVLTEKEENKKQQKQKFLNKQVDIMVKKIEYQIKNKKVLIKRAKKGKPYIKNTFYGDKDTSFCNDDKEYIYNNVNAFISRLEILNKLYVSMDISQYICHNLYEYKWLCCMFPFVGVPLLLYKKWKHCRLIISIKIEWVDNVNGVYHI